MLMTHGGDLTSKSNYDHATPLHYAAEQGLVAAALRFLRGGTDPNVEDRVGHFFQ